MPAPDSCVHPRDPAGDENDRRVAAYVWNAFEQLCKTEWLLPTQVEQKQMQSFRRILEHCLDQVPYYQQALPTKCRDARRFRSLADLTSIPILSRQSYQRHCEGIRAAHLPISMTTTGTVSTSGTSGMPVRVEQTNIVNLWWCAFAMRDLVWSGIDSRGRLGVIRSLHTRGAEQADFNQGLSLATWGRPFSEWLETGPSFALDIQCSMERQLEWLLEVQPDCLLSFPSNLDSLACYLSGSGREVASIQVIQTMAEKLTPDVRQRIETAFRAPVRDTYSCQEAGYLASQCPLTGLYHVHAENVILEIVDDSGHQVAAGETGRVLLTTLMNFQTPLLRYEVGDEATVGTACDCGRGLPVLERIHGKTRPNMALKSGHSRNSSALAELISRVPGYLQYQVEQHSVTSVTLRLVPGENWNDSSHQQLAGILLDFFGSDADIQIELCQRIAPDTGGKTPAFIPMNPRRATDFRVE